MKLKILLLLVLPVFLYSITFDEVYKATLNDNDNIRSLEFKLKAKLKDESMSKAELYPKVTGTIGAVEREYTRNNFLSEKEEEIYKSYKIVISQTIYNHTIYKAMDEARLGIELNKLQIIEEKGKTLLEALDAYILALINKSFRDLSIQERDYYSFKSLQSQKFFEKSLISKDVYDSLNLDYNSAKVAAVKAQNDYDLSLHKLATYIDNDIDSISDLDDKSFFIIEGSAEDLVNKNISIKIALADYALAKKRVEVSRSRHYPTINVTADYIKYDSNNDVNDYKEDQKVVFSMNIPLFNGWYHSNRVQQDKLTAKASFYQVENIAKKVNKQLKELLFQKKINSKTIEVHQENLQATQEYFNSIKASYEKDLKSKVDLEEARVKVARAQHDLNESKLKSFRIVLEIKYLLGELIR